MGENPDQPAGEFAMLADPDRQPSAATPSRRQFGRIITAGALAAFPAPAFLRARNLNDRLRIAMIAVGGRGAANLEGVKGEDIVALCDVYEPAVLKAAESFPHARKEKDFRRLFDHAGEFDAVVVSTPEHTHAFATLPALQLNKHVYCEKPLTRDVYEARVIREAAARTRVATQMGTQGHSGENPRQVVELVRAGAIGKVTEAHVWVSRAWGWQSAEAAAKNQDIVSTRDRPEGSSPVPAGLDWDLWVGPAPDRPFHDVYFPGPRWYRWWDFGNGTMSDLGSHRNDLPFWAMSLKVPKTIEAFGPSPHPELAPASMRVVYEFEENGDQPAARLTWYQGEDKPDLWTRGEIPQWHDACLLVGSEGMILTDHQKHVLLPEDRFRDFQPPPPTIARSPGHYAEWIEACKTGSPTTCNFEYAGWLTEANHLGNVAFRAGKKLVWDSPSMSCPNAPEASAFLRRDYRKGWHLA